MLVNKEENIVQCAAELARELHKGQVDKAGIDYFTGHLTAVAQMGSTWQEQAVGYLHDASEDTPYSVEEMLNLLDDKLGTPLSDTDRLELADALHLLNHHLDLSRIPNPVEKDYERVERYKQEFAYLGELKN